MPQPSRPITRSDGRTSVTVGRPEEIEERRLMRSVKGGAGNAGVSPEQLVAIRKDALAGGAGGVVERDGVIQSADAPVAARVSAVERVTGRAAPVAAPASVPAAAPAAVPETVRVGPDRLGKIIEKAKARLVDFNKQAAEKHVKPGAPGAAKNEPMRYKPDVDTGRKAGEARTKDKYYPDYAAGRDYLKKLKTSLVFKASRVTMAMRKTRDPKAYGRLKELKTEIMAELTKLADVAQDLRMKPVSYPPEKDIGRQEGEKRSKDKYVPPAVNPINQQLEKMWERKTGIPKTAMPRSTEDLRTAAPKKDDGAEAFDATTPKDEGKDTKPKGREMGGNDMKPPPKDKGAEERKEPPKGKEKDRGTKDQKSNLQKSIDELRKKDDEFEKEIDALTEAVEGLGGTVKKEKGKRPEKPEEPEKPPRAPGMKMPPSGKPPMGRKPPEAPGKPLAIEEILGRPKAEGNRGLRRPGRRGCKAEFTRESGKLNSYWTVTDPEGKVVLKATAKQIFGTKTFGQWDWLSSEDYGRFLLARIRSEGVRKVAKLLGTEPVMTKEAMRIEIHAKDKARAPALTKKVTNLKDYYSKAYGDPGYAAKLVKKHGPGRKPHGQTRKKAEAEDDRTVVALNKELEAENERLRAQVTEKAAEADKAAEARKEAEAVSADKDLNESLRLKAEKAFHLANKMMEKKIITAEEIDGTVEDMVLMDDLGFATMENAIDSKVIRRVEETEKAVAAKARITRTGGLDVAPTTPVVEMTMKDRLEGMWRRPKTPTKTQ